MNVMDEDISVHFVLILSVLEIILAWWKKILEIINIESNKDDLQTVQHTIPNLNNGQLDFHTYSEWTAC